MTPKATQSKAFEYGSIAFSPSLAKAFGPCGALLIQQIHYWCVTHKDDPKHFVSGYNWSWNSTKELANQLGCYDERTIKRVAMELRTIGVLVVGNYNQKAYDRTLWYRIDYPRLQAVLIDKSIGINYHDPLGHFFTTHSVQMSQPIPETIPKTTEETSAMDFAMVTPKLKIKLGKQTTSDMELQPMKQPTSSSAILLSIKVANGTAPSTSNTSKSLQHYWKRLVPKHHPTVGMMPELTIVQKGQLTHLAKALGSAADRTVQHVVPNWIGFCKFVESQAGLKKTPDVPQIGFLLKHVTEALNYSKESVQLTAPKKKIQAKVSHAPSPEKSVKIPVAVNEKVEPEEMASADFMLNWTPPTD